MQNVYLGPKNNRQPCTFLLSHPISGGYGKSVALKIARASGFELIFVDTRFIFPDHIAFVVLFFFFCFYFCEQIHGIEFVSIVYQKRTTFHHRTKQISAYLGKFFNVVVKTCQCSFQAF